MEKNDYSLVVIHLKYKASLHFVCCLMTLICLSKHIQCHRILLACCPDIDIYYNY